MAEHRLVDLEGIRLAYQVWGLPDDPPLVLLHALGEDAADWDAVAPVLARGRRVYALDLRGHGRSWWPGNYSLDLMRADVLHFLDELGLGRVDLVGHSMGGIVAYLLASEHPQRVARLVLEDVPLPLPRQPTTLTRPNGELTFDWAMAVAIRKQIDTPDPMWLERLDGITAETLIMAGVQIARCPKMASPSWPAASPVDAWSPSRSGT
jgi:3-oxoadipate enol-lactonase